MTAEIIQTDFLDAENILMKEVDNILKEETFSNEDIESMRILYNYGFRNFEQRREHDENNFKISQKKDLESLKPHFSGFKLIGDSHLSFIIKKYNLEIKDPKFFTSKIPLEASNFILAFFEKAKKSDLTFDLQIVAPANMFNKNLTSHEKDDPIILANWRNRNASVIIYAWGAEKNILNKEDI